MSALHPSWPQADGTPGREAPTASTTTYRLVYNAPEDATPGYGLGWTLVGEPNERWPGTMALAARGAGVHAGPRVAKAVAVRVLAQQGITVEAWAHGPPTHDVPAEPPIFVATVRLSIQSGPVPRRTERPPE